MATLIPASTSVSHLQFPTDGYLLHQLPSLQIPS